MNSLASLDEGVNYAEVLLHREGKLPDPPPPGTDEEAELLALRGGVSVLIVSVFELFLKTLFMEQVSRLTPQPPVVDFYKLPERIQVTSVFENLGAALKGPRGGGGKRVDRIPAIIRASKLATAEIVHPEAFVNTQSNPGPDTVKAMFNDVGMEKIFETIEGSFVGMWGNSVAGSFIEDKLREIVQRRNSVAHSLDLRRITRSDLMESVLFIEALGKVLAEALERHVDRLLIQCAPDPA